MGAIHLEKASAIDGWMAPVELAWLARTANISKNIIEVGSYKGRSTRALCDNTTGRVTAVDPWNGPYITNHGKVLFDQSKSWLDFQRNLADVKNLTIFRGTYAQFGEINKDTTYDFIFIDGDHRYNAVVHDIELALTMLTKNGVLAGHDYRHPDWPGVKQAVDERFPNREVIKSIWWTLKS